MKRLKNRKQKVDKYAKIQIFVFPFMFFDVEPYFMSFVLSSAVIVVQ